MPKYGSDDVFLLVDGHDLSGLTFELELNKETEVEETHGFGDSWVEVETTDINRGGVTQRGWYDDATDKTSDALVANPGVSRVLLAGIEGNVQGGAAVGFQGAMQRNIARNPARGELTKISAEYLSDGEVDDVDHEIVQTLSAEAGDGATSDGSWDNGGASANGGAAYLEVTALALGGYTNVEVKLQESSDDGTDPWADVAGGTFTVVTTAPNAERLVLAPLLAIEQYVRVLLTWNGAGSSESITLIVTLVRDP